jgi:hypothetical protein
MLKYAGERREKGDKATPYKSLEEPSRPYKSILRGEIRRKESLFGGPNKYAFAYLFGPTTLAYASDTRYLSKVRAGEENRTKEPRR